MDNRRVPTEAQKDVAEKSLENMLGQMDPRLAEMLKSKFDAESREFEKAAREADPSKGDPSYWAKRSCNKCYGRGIIGKRTVFRPNEGAKSDGKGGYENQAFTLDVRCRCGAKKYQRWLAKFRLEYNAAKEAQVEEGQNDSEESESTA